MLVVADVTEQLHQQEVATERSRIQAAEAVTGALMHELNQPLTVITVQSHLLLHDLDRGTLDADQIRSAVEEIVSQAVTVADKLRQAQSFRSFVTKPYLEGHDIVDLEKST